MPVPVEGGRRPLNAEGIPSRDENEKPAARMYNSGKEKSAIS